MKILLINWIDMKHPRPGGAEVHISEIFARFAARGDEVTWVGSGFPGGAARDVYRGMRILRTGTWNTFNLVLPRFLRELDRAEDFDIVVEDINKVPFFTPLYLKKPLLAVVPHLFGTAVFRETGPLTGSYVWLMERPIPRVYRSARFEAISESTAADLARRGVDPGRIEVVHCGLDHDTYSVDPAVGKFDRTTILYVGRLKRYKSVDAIVRALPAICGRVPDARLVVVGTGDHEEGLKALAARLGVADRIEWTGFASTAEKVDWLRRSHVIVNPSPKEGWGLTNVEANACGTVAVASDVDGHRDSVLDGVTGLLFPYGDHEALADQVTRVLTDDGLRGRLLEKALDRAATFTWDRAARETMDIVDGIAGGG